jgi:hypothetical protein
VRALTQWVLDYGADGSGAGFPFDCPMLDLYKRCNQALRIVESLLEHPSEDKQINRALVILHRILLPVRVQIPFKNLALSLEARARLFHKLRDVLRIELKPKVAVAFQKSEREQKLTELHDAEKALAAFEESLRKGRPQRGPAQDIREAIDIILKHLERHGSNLWGHLIERPDGTTILAARTNVLLEKLFGGQGPGDQGARDALDADRPVLRGRAGRAAGGVSTDALPALRKRAVRERVSGERDRA